MNVFHDDVNTLVFENNTEGDVLSFMGKDLNIVDSKAMVSNIRIGEYQFIQSKVHGRVRIDQRFIVKTDFFNATWTDKNARLGSSIVDGNTVFTLWAPTAVSVNLLFDDRALKMERSPKGVYSIQVAGNQSGLAYHYQVEVNGKTNIICDPYAKASLPNREASIVCDMKFKTEAFEKRSDVILEMHVRDFSMDPSVPFANRGKLLGLLESHGEFGMNHILDLGVGMIQLQPLSDFETVDERNPFDRYNWGYDPMQYFALEGSYSSNIKDPLQVLRDLSTVINAYHKEGIAVSMDVVFNHIYEVEDSSLNSAVPYYYFRYDKNHLCNGTFCGNELASEYTMVRKLIVDACVYFVETFGIDGYRFDLMGITDIETMVAIQKALPDTVKLYGEGWNMDCGLDPSLRATMQNHKKLPGFAFFNDQFRDLIGGPLDGGGVGIAGDLEASLLNDAMAGSPSLFDDADQSINYVECHDNYTLADKLALNNLGVASAYPYLEAVLKAKGTPFLQIGQSFFRNKKGVENSYKSPDAVNRIEWQGLIENADLNDFVKKLIAQRQNH